LTARAHPCDVLLVKPAPDQRAAFEALLAQVLPLCGDAAEGYARELRRLWRETDDHEAMLQALVQQIRELRSKAEGEDPGEDPAAS
jgi:hypothetical protein